MEGISGRIVTICFFMHCDFCFAWFCSCLASQGMFFDTPFTIWIWIYSSLFFFFHPPFLREGLFQLRSIADGQSLARKLGVFVGTYIPLSAACLFSLLLLLLLRRYTLEAQILLMIRLQETTSIHSVFFPLSHHAFSHGHQVRTLA